MKTFTRLLILCFLVFMLNPLSAQEKSAVKNIGKLDKYIRKDNYKAAIKKGKQLETRLEAQNLADSIDFMLYERINRAAVLNGNVSSSIRYLDKAVDSYDKADNTALFIPFIRMLVFNGRYDLASTYMHQRYKDSDFTRTAESDLLLHRILLHRGEIRKAIVVENDILTELEAAKTLIKEKSKKEAAAFWENYFAVHLQKGQRIALQGLNKEAYEFLAPLRKEVLPKTPKKSDLRPDYFELLGKIALEMNNYELAEEHFDKALEQFTENHSVRHPQGIRLLASCLQTYALLGKDRKLLDQTKKYYPDLGYYKSQRSSLNTVPLLLTEVERKASYGSFKDADKLATQLYELAAKYPDAVHPHIYDLNANLYQYFLARDRFDEAAKCLAVCQSNCRNLVGAATPAFALQQLINAQYVINCEFDREAATIFTSPAWELYQENYGKAHGKYLPLLNTYAQSFALSEMSPRQIAVLQEASKTAEELYGQDYTWAKQQILLAEAELNAGNFAAVPLLVNPALPIIEKAEGTNSIYYLSGSRVLAENLENTGRADEARTIYRKTFRKLDRLSRRAGVSSFSQPEKLAQVYMLNGEYEEAEELLQRSIDQKVKVYGARAKTLLVEPYVLSARVKFMKGNYIGAQQDARKAIEISRDLNSENSLKVLQANKLLAEIDFAIGDYKSASTRLEKILEKQYATLGNSHPEIANTTLQFAQANYYAYGNGPENLGRVGNSINIYRNTLGGSSLALANALVYEALFLMELDSLPQALLALDEAMLIYGGQLEKGNINEARILRLRGDVYFRQQRFAEAEKAYSESASVFRQLFDKHHPEYLKSQSKLARTKAAEGKYSDALGITMGLTENYLHFVDDFFPYMSEREKSKYWNQLKSDFELYYSLVAKVAPENQSQLQKMFEYRVKTKALLLNSSLKFQSDVKAADDELVSELFSSWLDQKKELARTIGLSAREQQEAGINVDELEASIGNTEKLLSEELYKGNTQQYQSPSYKNIVKQLKSDEVLVEIIRYPAIADSSKPHYSFLILDPGASGLRLLTLTAGPEMEEGFYKYYRNAIKLEAKDKYSYNVFWQELDGMIADGKTVYLSPDGVYMLINPETLKDTAGIFVLDKNQLVMINNPGDLLKSSKGAGMPATAELIGDPEFYPSPTGPVKRLKQLPGASEELASLNNMLGGKGYSVGSLTKGDAREDSVKTLHSPTILHFATHGYFEDDEKPAISSGLREEESGKHPLLQSGLILYNGGEILAVRGNGEFYSQEGILTAFEAKDLDLANTEIVVLSACETGLGRISVGEGVYGLQRSFLDAGARSVLMSLFKVNDEATRELMIAFYKHWLETGDKQKALVMAKKEIKEKYKEPLYWGSFILVGK